MSSFKHRHVLAKLSWKQLQLLRASSMRDPEGKTIRLKDGRSLGYRILGDPSGTPLFFFHGTPGSRFCLTVDDPIANIAGLKLILPERPGYGLSDPMKDRTIQNWPNDVVELADELSIDHFHVSGSSGGGPYALACGTCLADRILSVMLFNTAAPLDGADATKGLAMANRVGRWAATYAPWLLRKMIHVAAKSMQKYPETSIRSLMKQLPQSDRELLEQPEYKAAVIRDLKEAVRVSADGHWSDAVLGMRPWNINFNQLKRGVHLWHGEEDTLSPVQNVRLLADKIPNCTSTYIAGAGHLLIDIPLVVDGVRDVVLGS